MKHIIVLIISLVFGVEVALAQPVTTQVTPGVLSQAYLPLTGGTLSGTLSVPQLINSTRPILLGLPTALTNGNLIYTSMQNAGVSGLGLVGGSDALLQYSNDVSSTFLGFFKSRQTVKGGAHVTVQNGDDIGEINANADDGTNFVDIGSIDFIACGTISTGVVPSCLTTYLTNAAGSQVNVELQSATAVKIVPTTISTSTTTGAFIIAGGLGVAGAAWFGGNVTSPTLTLGTVSTTQGSLILQNTTAYPTTVKSSNSASAAWTMTLPVTAGVSGNVIQTNGSGVTSWTTAGGLKQVYDITNIAYGCSTALSDNSSCVQAAINAANTAGGGVVWVPPVLGQNTTGYILTHQVTLKSGVTLQGAGGGGHWNPSSTAPPNGLAYGSIFFIEWGSCSLGGGCSTTAADDAILMDSNTKIDGIGFDYPTAVTTGSTPTEYGATVAFYGTTYGNFDQVVTNNTFNKSFVAIDARGSLKGSGVGFWNISYNYGCPIAYFLKLDWVFDFGYTNNLNFKACSSNLAAGVDSWSNANGVGIYLGNADGLWLDHINQYGMNKGVVIDYSPMVYSGCGPVTLSNSEFDADQTGISFKDGSCGGYAGALLDIHSNKFSTFNPYTGTNGNVLVNGGSTDHILSLNFQNNLVNNYQAGPSSYMIYLNNGTVTLGTAIITGNYGYGQGTITVPAYQLSSSGTTRTIIARDNEAIGYSTFISNGTVTNSDISSNFN